MKQKEHYPDSLSAIKKLVSVSPGELARNSGYRNTGKWAKRFSDYLRSGMIRRDILMRLMDGIESPVKEELLQAFHRDEERIEDLKEAKKNRSRRELELLAAYNDLLLHECDRILWRADFAFVPVYQAGASIISGCSGPLVLGELVEIWSTTSVHEECNQCGGKLRMIATGGSMLSGRHSTVGFCVSCVSIQKMERDWHALFDAREKLRSLFPDGCDRPPSLKELLRELNGGAGPGLADHDDDGYWADDTKWESGYFIRGRKIEF